MLTIKNGTGRNAVFLLALAILVAGCLPPGPRAVLVGKRLIQQGRYSEAIDQLKLATRLLETNALAWEYLGLAYHHAGQVANAVKAYRQALKLDRGLVEVHYNLGCLGLEVNRKDWLNYAKSELTTYALMRSNSVEGWIRLGTAELRLNELAKAERSFQKALQLNPQDPEALNDLGLTKVREGNSQKAQEYFNSALAQQPDYAPALLNLGVLYQQHLHDTASALREYHEYLGVSKAGPNREAVRAAVRALEQKRPAASPPAAQSAPPPRRKAVARAVQKPTPAPRQTAPEQRPAAATPSRETNKPTAPESKRSPSGAPARSRPAATTVASRPAKPEPKPKSQQEKAPQYLRYRYRHPAKPKPGNTTAARRAFIQGVQAQRAHRWREAVQSYLQATRLDPADYNAYYNMGLAATSAGNPDLALKAYETALAIRPDSPDARYNFALLLNREGYPVDAANELKKVLARRPGDARAHLALGNLYAEKLHQPEKARQQYEQVLQNDPQNSQAHAIRAWLRAHAR